MIFHGPFSPWLLSFFFILFSIFVIILPHPSQSHQRMKSDIYCMNQESTEQKGGGGGKEKMQWERGTAVVTEETDILFSHTWSKNTALRQKMLSEYSTHTSGVNWFWAHNALVVKYLATMPMKSMSEILFCYIPENLQIFNAAVCTWRKNWSKV